jgi:hypothetical protein
MSSEQNRESCLLRQLALHQPVGRSRASGLAEPGGQQRTARDNEPRGQRPFTVLGLGRETAGARFPNSRGHGLHLVLARKTIGAAHRCTGP